MATKQGERTRARLEKRFPRVKDPEPEVLVANGRAWVKVAAARPWHPAEPGEVLVGELVGRSTRPGAEGIVYGVVTLRTPEGRRTISGVVISSLFESAACRDGSTVRVVYLGERTSGAGRTYRDYELFLALDEQRAEP